MNKKRFALSVLALVLMPFVAVIALATSGGLMGKDLPILGTVPSFSLADQNGKELTLESLQGKVWIASFIFTHCDRLCPVITAHMKRIQRSLRLKEKIRFVSFTVDPARDTEEVLAEYAKR